MGWDIDHIMWHLVRDKILKDRYAGCEYWMFTSDSPVIIRHREPLPMTDRRRIWKLFPKHIRVEFQEVGYDGERVDVHGRGQLISPALTRALADFICDKDAETHEYKKSGNNWERTKGEK